MVGTGELEQINWLEMLHDLKFIYVRREHNEHSDGADFTSQNTSVGICIIQDSFPTSPFCMRIFQWVVLLFLLGSGVPLDCGPVMREPIRPSFSIETEKRRFRPASIVNRRRNNVIPDLTLCYGFETMNSHFRPFLYVGDAADFLFPIKRPFHYVKTVRRVRVFSLDTFPYRSHFHYFFITFIGGSYPRPRWATTLKLRAPFSISWIDRKQVYGIAVLYFLNFVHCRPLGLRMVVVDERPCFTAISA